MRLLIKSMLLLAVLLASNTFAKSVPLSYDTLFTQLDKLAPDFSKSADISDLKFEIDAGKFLLESGQVILLTDVDGMNIGFYFEGEGKFHLESPNPVERFSIKKFTKKEKLDQKLTKALFLYSPDLYDTIFAGIDFNPVHEEGSIKSLVKKWKNDFIDLGYDYRAEIMLKIYDSTLQPYLISVLKCKRNTYYYLYDLARTESVNLIKKGALSDFDLVTSFYPQSYYESGGNLYDRDPVKLADALSYNISITIKNNTDLIGECELTLVSRRSNLYGLKFHHYFRMQIDSIIDSDGFRYFVIDDYNDDKNPGYVIVSFDDPLPENDTLTLKFFYHSKDIIKRSSWGDFYLRSPYGWYPGLVGQNYATFRVKYKTQKWLTLVSTGEEISDSVDGEWRYTEWAMDEPVLIFSFNYGMFDSLVLNEPNLPTVKVYRSQAAHTGRLFGADMLDVTARDIMAALQFCSNMFCPYPYKEMVATEIPYFARGQSFPGFMHLGLASFDNDFDARKLNWDAFRAHEVSHQWWGHIVGWKSYHDQWLSEAFAEYTSAWFVQAKDKNNKRFLSILDDWQKAATQKGGLSGEWSEGSEAGPIWLGYRLSSTKSSDYSNLVYAKGAYVLYMLRMILHDYKTHSDDRFIEMMRKFVLRFKGEKASTIDFIRHTERYFQMDMDWFFDQWIFGTEIPKFKPKYEVVEQDGGYIVKASIKVEKVSDGWKMVVPLVVEFENDKHIVLKFWVTAPFTEYKSKVLPYKPKKFIFNPYKAVLCR